MIIKPKIVFKKRKDKGKYRCLSGTMGIEVKGGMLFIKTVMDKDVNRWFVPWKKLK